MPAVAKIRNVKPINAINIENLTSGFRKFAMASVGAVAVANDQVRSQAKTVWTTLDKLADRGETAQATGRKAVRQFVTKRTEDVKKGAETISDRFEGRFSGLLGRLNVPTKSDITELTRRIDSLTRKIDKL